MWVSHITEPLRVCAYLCVCVCVLPFFAPDYVIMANILSIPMHLMLRLGFSLLLLLESLSCLPSPFRSLPFNHPISLSLSLSLSLSINRPSFSIIKLKITDYDSFHLFVLHDFRRGYCHLQRYSSACSEVGATFEDEWDLILACIEGTEVACIDRTLSRQK